MTFIYYMSDPVYLSAMSKNAQLKIKIDMSERFSEKFFLQFLSNLCGTFGPHCISCFRAVMPWSKGNFNQPTDDHQLVLSSTEDYFVLCHTASFDNVCRRC